MLKEAKVLLTGRPGVGKTTVIKRFLERTRPCAVGFYTAEIRRAGRRIGFSLNLLDGRCHTLASVEIRGPHRVGKYGVDVQTLDRVAVAEIDGAIFSGRMLVVDEIGKMEMMSKAFRDAVLRAFDSPIPILGTILFRPHPVADRIRRRPDVTIIETTLDNRDRLPDELTRRFGYAVEENPPKGLPAG